MVSGKDAFRRSGMGQAGPRKSRVWNAGERKTKITGVYNSMEEMLTFGELN